jgi:hypothetical protein
MTSKIIYVFENVFRILLYVVTLRYLYEIIVALIEGSPIESCRVTLLRYNITKGLNLPYNRIIHPIPMSALQTLEWDG